MAAKKTAFQYQVKQSKFGDVDGVFPLLSTSVIQRYPWRDWQLACVCYLVLWTWTVLGIKPQVVHDKWLVGPRLIYKVMLRTQSASMAMWRSHVVMESNSTDLWLLQGAQVGCRIEGPGSLLSRLGGRNWKLGGFEATNKRSWKLTLWHVVWTLQGA